MALISDFTDAPDTTDEGLLMPGSNIPWPSYGPTTEGGFTESDLTSGSLPTRAPDLQRAEDPTILAPYLHNLERPLRALWGGVHQSFNDTEGDLEAFSTGARKGWNLETRHNPLTAFNILKRPEDAKDIMGFPEWFANATAMFAADVAGDPLNAIVPGLSKLGKATGITNELSKLAFNATDRVAGSGFGKATFNSLPKGSPQYEAAQAAADQLKYAGSNESILKMAAEKLPEWEAAKEAITKAQGGVPPTDIQLATAFEYWGQKIPQRPNYIEPALKDYAKSGQMSPYLREQLERGNLPVALRQEMEAGIVPQAIKDFEAGGIDLPEHLTSYLAKHKNPEWLDQWAAAGEVPKHYGDIIPVISEMKAAREQVRNEIRLAEIKRGVKDPRQFAAEDNLNYMPQISESSKPPWSGVKDWFTGKGKDVRLDPTGGTDPSRGLYQFLDKEEKIRAIGSPKDPRTGVTMLESAPTTPGGKGEVKYFLPTGEELVKHQAPLVYKQQMTPYLNWEADPMKAFTKGIQKEMPSSNYYQLFDKLEELGLIEGASQRMLTKGNIPAKMSGKDMAGTLDVIRGSKKNPELIRDPNYGHIDPDAAIDPNHYLGGAELPGSQAMLPKKNWRALSEDMPGGKGYQAPKTVANWLENQYAPDPYKWIKDSGPFRAASDMTQWWKNSVLPYFPSWILANAPTNLAMQYLHGTDAYKMPLRAWQAIKAERGKGAPTFEGINNAKLGSMFEDRGLRTGSFKDAWRDSKAGGQAGLTPETFMGEAATGSPQYGGKMRALADKAEGSAFSLPLRGIASAAEGMGRVGKMGYQLGSKVETNARMGQAIDYLMKENPKWALGSKAEREAAMNRATRFTNEAQVDYAKTPFEQLLAPVIPFYSWTKGSTKSIANSLLKDPRRLERYQLAMENYSTPMPEKDKKFASEYIQNQMPIDSWMGFPIKKWLGQGDRPGKATFLSSRFTPLQEPIEILRGILGGDTSMVLNRTAPWLKGGLEALSNRNFDTGQDVDRRVTELRGEGVPQGGLAHLTNPLFKNDTSYESATRNLFGKKIPVAYDRIANAIPGGRLLNQYVRPASNLGYELATGKHLDPRRPEQGDLQAALLQMALGMKIMPYDTEKNIKSQKYANQEAKQRAKYNLRKANQVGDTEEAEKQMRIRLQLPLEAPQNRW